MLNENLEHIHIWGFEMLFVELSYYEICIHIKLTSQAWCLSNHSLWQRHINGVCHRALRSKGKCKIYESLVINNGNAIYIATRVAIVAVAGRHCRLTRRTINTAPTPQMLHPPLQPCLRHPPIPLLLPVTISTEHESFRRSHSSLISHSAWFRRLWLYRLFSLGPCLHLIGFFVQLIFYIPSICSLFMPYWKKWLIGIQKFFFRREIYNHYIKGLHFNLSSHPTSSSLYRASALRAHSFHNTLSCRHCFVQRHLLLLFAHYLAMSTRSEPNAIRDLEHGRARDSNSDSALVIRTRNYCQRCQLVRIAAIAALNSF